jgi:hypothetical protein
MSESAWEPLTVLGPCPYVCVTEGCYQRATWLWKEHGAGRCADNLKCWVCDEHKAEPQPPTYSEWLAVQA